MLRFQQEESWAERITTRFVKGRPVRVWKKRDGDRNEALDCRVYSMAALQGLVAMGLQLNREAERLLEIPLKEETGRLEERPAKPATKPPQRRVYLSPWMM